VPCLVRARRREPGGEPCAVPDTELREDATGTSIPVLPVRPRSSSTSTYRLRASARRGAQVGSVVSLPKKALETKVERTGIEPVTSGLQTRPEGLQTVAASPAAR